MTEAAGTRQLQKERTRRRLLDAALDLLEHGNLDSLGVREITRRAGLTPNAFYRHFDSIEELGLVLVDESFGALRAMTTAVRAEVTPELGTIRPTVDVVVDHVRQRPAHFRFILRERFGGVALVRRAIQAEIRLFVQEVATHMSRVRGLEHWTVDDVRLLSEILVDTVVSTVGQLLEVPEDRPDLEDRVRRDAVRRLGIVANLGRRGPLEPMSPSLVSGGGPSGGPPRRRAWAHGRA